MKTDKILIPALVGTSAMTLFSYQVTESKNKNFREPELLGILIKRLPISVSKESAQMAGWGMHYAIGILFVVFYSELWDRTIVKPSLTTGTLLGTGSGIIGVTGWKVMFEGHPNPPAKNLKPFFGHLLLAHIVFGIFSAITYKFTNAIKVHD